MKYWRNIVNFPFAWPFIIIYILSSKRVIVNRDIEAWERVNNPNISSIRNYSKTFYSKFISYPEFRSLFYYRIGKWIKLISWMYKGQDHLVFDCPEIGGGFYIQHGYCTDISARHIGSNCWINQKVTIGYKGTSCPWIGDNVRIGVGAIIIGDVTIGNDAKIGAGAVVVKDVPAGALAACQPANNITKCNE